MNYRVSNFAAWSNSVNEQRAVQKTGSSKVVAVPLEADSFKVKIVSDLDVIDAETNKLKSNGWQAILNWLLQQPVFMQKYPSLKDMKSNFVVYEIKKDTDRRQVISFVVRQRSTVPNLKAEIQAVTADELTKLSGETPQTSTLNALTAASNTDTSNILKTDDASKTASTAGSKIKLSRALTFSEAKLLKSESPLFKMIDDLYIKFLSLPQFKEDPISAKIKAELKGGAIGDNTIKFIKALAAGFGYKDKYGDLIDTIDQQLVDGITALNSAKLAESTSQFIGLTGRLVEESPMDEITPPAGELEKAFSTAKFDSKAFITALIGGSTSITDIKFPDGGFKKASTAKKDAEFAKVQKAILDRASTSDAIKGAAAYKNFAKYGADGNYGPATATMITFLKKGLHWNDTTGDIVTSDFLANVKAADFNKPYASKPYESKQYYIGLNGMLVESTRTDEQFDFGSADTVKPVSNAGGSKSSGGLVKINLDEIEKAINAAGLTAGRNDAYGADNVHFISSKMKIGGKSIQPFIWKTGMAVRIGTGSEWEFKLGEPAKKIKLNLTSSSNLTGSFSANGKDYAFNGVNSLVANIYTAISGQNAPEQVQPANLEEVDVLLEETANDIKSFIENSDNFSAYSGGVNDNEQGAWDDIVYSKFKKVIAAIQTNIVPKVESLKESDSENYGRYEKTLDELGRLLTGKKHYFIGAPASLSEWTFKQMFLGSELFMSSTDTDTYDFYVYLSTGTKKISIDTDF